MTLRRLASFLVLAMTACHPEMSREPPILEAPNWGEHVLSTSLAEGHHYLRFDIPGSHTFEDVEAFYSKQLELAGWTRQPPAAGPGAASEWTTFRTTDGDEGVQRFVDWVDPSGKWDCRLGLYDSKQARPMADIVLQPSGEVPIDAR